MNLSAPPGYVLRGESRHWQGVGRPAAAFFSPGMIAMNLDLHVSRFDWAGGPAGIGPGVKPSWPARPKGSACRTLSFMDHFFQMEMMAPAEDPMLEGYTALGFVAGVTQRLRLRLLVTGVTYRYPGLLAKTVTTLDVSSGGRAELGTGAAWYEREHKGLGVAFPPIKERFEQLEEALAHLPADVEPRQRAVRRASATTWLRPCAHPRRNPRAAPSVDHDRWRRRGRRPCASSPSMATRATSSDRQRWSPRRSRC